MSEPTKQYQYLPPHSPIQQNLKERAENFHSLKSDILSVFWPLIQIVLNFYQNRKILQHLNIKKTVRETIKQNVRFETMTILIYELLLLYHSNLFRIRLRTKQIIEGRREFSKIVVSNIMTFTLQK